MRKWLGVLVAAWAAGCATEAEVDSDELTPGDLSTGPVVEFDPPAVVPLPNNLALNPLDGTLNIAPRCAQNESASQTALREELERLDGFNVSGGGIEVTFTAEVDASSLEGRIFLVNLSNPTDAIRVRLAAVANRSRVVNCEAQVTNAVFLQPVINDGQAITAATPRRLLEDNTTYAVAVLDGVTDTAGNPFGITATWKFARLPENAVQVERDATGTLTAVLENNTPFDSTTAEGRASINGVDLLWQAHKPVLDGLSQILQGPLQRTAPLAREEFLAAWSFNTQTIEAPFDPAATPRGKQSPAATVVGSEAADVTVQPATDLGAFVSISGTFRAFDFQRPVDFGAVEVPGTWNDPLAPTQPREVDLGFVAFAPDPAVTSVPNNGWPVVIFGHGLTGDKGNLLAIAGQLAAQGIASIAFDWVAHGDRAVQISTEGPCTPGIAFSRETASCFAPFFSANLAVTRDNVRQSIVDGLKLVDVLKYCGAQNCGDLQVNPGKIGYLGQSLGALIGSTLTAVSPDINAAVLNTGGSSWVRIFRDTQSQEIQCPVVDSLIAAGLLTGNLWTGATNPNESLCVEGSWKNDPAYLEFEGLATWILEPADSVHFVSSLRTKPVFIQEVKDDAVVPAASTATLAALLGLQQTQAAVANTTTPGPSTLPAPGAGAYLLYQNTTGTPPNTYTHSSLLLPATAPGGAEATAQMQTDAITFLTTNVRDIP